jgi:hypothetical protein
MLPVKTDRHPCRRCFVGVELKWKVFAPPADDRVAFRATPLLLIPEFASPY